MGNGTTAPATSTTGASPYVLEQLRKRKVEELDALMSDAETHDEDRKDPKQRARRKELRLHISELEKKLEQAAGLVPA